MVSRLESSRLRQRAVVSPYLSAQTVKLVSYWNAVLKGSNLFRPSRCFQENLNSRQKYLDSTVFWASGLLTLQRLSCFGFCNFSEILHIYTATSLEKAQDR